MTPAEQQWADALAALAIPDPILAAAPVSPYGFDVGMFTRVAEEARASQSPSQGTARAALPEGGSVLDVGCGGGAGSLPLVPPAGHVVGVDEHAGMLEAFAAGAEALGVAHTESWDAGPTWPTRYLWPTWLSATTSSTTPPTWGPSPVP